MQIACPSCSTQYTTDESHLPPGGTSITCPRCGVRFSVKPPPGSGVGGASGPQQWDEATEEYARPLPAIVRDPADDRDMWCVTPRLRIDTTPVSRAAYRRFVEATGRQGPADLPPAPDDAPVVCVTLEDARAYARWAKKRLPLQGEWHEAMRVVGLDVARGGDIWEWTASRHSGGHVVRGGRSRETPHERGRLHHRSWEEDAMPDVGFRCVADT